MSSSSSTAASASASTSSTGGYRPFHRSNSSNSSSLSIENLPPRTLARVSKEVRTLMKNPPEGVRLVVDPETGLPASLGELVAEIEGPQGTPYENRYFRLKLVLGVDFPNSPPRGFFLTKIYHPNVDMTTGAICVNTLKKDWSAETTFSHILSVIRCLLIYPFPESSLNDEAGKLFMESYDEYSKRARLMADVHGRTEPTNKSDDGDDQLQTRKSDSKNDEDSDDGDSPQRQKSRIDPTSNPLTSKDSTNNIAVNSKSYGGGSSTTTKPKPAKSMGQKQPSARLTKKKSLKRL
mmetsp:Transcript_21965/g.51783  ORF Transcript_21965/g.51783 Transcript_21965/m.51783 type:complete len:293 (+) Transcript_21965:221-1099(+)